MSFRLLKIIFFGGGTHSQSAKTLSFGSDEGPPSRGLRRGLRRLPVQPRPHQRGRLLLLPDGRPGPLLPPVPPGEGRRLPARLPALQRLPGGGRRRRGHLQDGVRPPGVAPGGGGGRERDRALHGHARRLGETRPTKAGMQDGSSERIYTFSRGALLVGKSNPEMPVLAHSKPNFLEKKLWSFATVNCISKMIFPLRGERHETLFWPFEKNSGMSVTNSERERRGERYGSNT